MGDRGRHKSPLQSHIKFLSIDERFPMPYIVNETPNVSASGGFLFFKSINMYLKPCTI